MQQQIHCQIHVFVFTKVKEVEGLCQILKQFFFIFAILFPKLDSNLQ